MAVAFEVSKYLDEHPSATKLLRYMYSRKAATVYQIAEAIREQPSVVRDDLATLRNFGVVDLPADHSQSGTFIEPMHILTGYGHEVAATLDRGTMKR